MSHARSASFLLAVTVAAATVGGCYRNAQRGAVIGAGGGAVVGGAIGAATGSTAKGAIIGAVVGGAAGAIIGDQMDRQAKEIDQNIPGATVERVGEGIQVTFASGMLYDFDSDVVRPAAQENLRELARSLEKYPKSSVMIVGHTDSVGSDSYNETLSQRRSRAAADYLAAQGVARSRIEARGLGEREPVAANDTESGRQQNRRVEVAIFASEQYREEVKRQAGGR